MDFFDVLFPVNIGPLTYRCPDAFSQQVKPGMVISAQLKKSMTHGIILKKTAGRCQRAVKDILAVHGSSPILSGYMIRLLQWMSDYYIAEQGLVLKNIVPKEILLHRAVCHPGKREIRQVDPKSSSGDDLQTVPIDHSIIDMVKSSIHAHAYRCFLLHTPSSTYAFSSLMKCITDARNVIILVPEIRSISKLYDPLFRHFGQRLCLFHSKLSRSARREAFERILSHQSDIVLGTRSAVFAPLKKISFLVVLGEHSVSYKQENSPCYHARDVAVMRGYFEKATVLLISVSPSIESLSNCKLGKYTLLKPTSDSGTPKIKVIDMRYERQIAPYLSKTVVDAAAKQMSLGRKIMFVVNRRGYATLLECPDCDFIEECPVCKIPLVFHKEDMSMKCHYCGVVRSPVPEFCSRCGGHNIQMHGSGTQRIQEDIEKILGIRGLRIDSDKMRRKSMLRAAEAAAAISESSILIGTKLMTRRLDSNTSFSMAAILNADSLLNLPDFRSAERAYQEICAVRDTIAPDGEILVQTRIPHHYVFKALKAFGCEAIYREELRRRKTLMYPPFSRLILLTWVTKRDLTQEILMNLKRIDHNVEILGPSATKNKKGAYECKLLLRSPIRGQLHAAARSILEKFRASRDARVKVDVDPQSI